MKGIDFTNKQKGYYLFWIGANLLVLLLFGDASTWNGNSKRLGDISPFSELLELSKDITYIGGGPPYVFERYNLLELFLFSIVPIIFIMGIRLLKIEEKKEKEEKTAENKV